MHQTLRLRVAGLPALLATALLAACSDTPSAPSVPDAPERGPRAALAGGGYEPSPTPTVPTCTIVTCPINVGGGPLLAGRYFGDMEGYDIVLIPTGMGIIKRITTAPGWEYTMALSPDRTRIAFGTTRHGGSVYVVNVDGTGLKKLANVDSATMHHVHGVAWSPDGKKIAYAGTVNGQADIFLINADGTGKTQVTNDSYTDLTPVFTPDGANLIISSTRGTAPATNRELWRITLAGASVLRLTNTPQDEKWPTFSPDGQKLLYHRRDFSANTHAMLLTNGWGQNPTLLLTHPGAAFFEYPSFSPDGQWFAYSLKDAATGKMTVWRSPLANPAGGAVQVTSSDVTHNWPRWSN